MKNREERLLKNTTILSFGTLCTKAMMFVLIPILTRLVSTEEYGLFDLIYTYITLLVPVLTIGISDGTFRFLLDSKNNDEKGKIISNVFMAEILEFVFLLFLVLIGKIVFNYDFFLVILVFIYLVSEILFDFFGKILRGLKKIQYFTISNILFVVGICIGTYIFVYLLKLNLYGILLSYIIGDVISNVFMFIFGKIYSYLKKIKFDLIFLKKIINYSYPLIFAGISWWIISVSDRTVTTIFCGLSLTGIYAIANKIPSLVQTFYNVFQLSWLENASETINDKDREEYYNKVYNTMFVILCSISVLLLGTNFIFFDYFFSNDYYEAIYHSPILILATLFNMLGNFFGGIYVAKMQTKRQGGTVFFAAIINLFVDLCLIHFVGLYAASISTLVSYVALYLIRYFDIKRDLKISLSKNNKLLFVVLIYFFTCCYFNIFAIKIINLMIAIAFFITLNKNKFMTILRKVVRHERKS